MESNQSYYQIFPRHTNVTSTTELLRGLQSSVHSSACESTSKCKRTILTSSKSTLPCVSTPQIIGVHKRVQWHLKIGETSPPQRTQVHWKLVCPYLVSQGTRPGKPLTRAQVRMNNHKNSSIASLRHYICISSKLSLFDALQDQFLHMAGSVCECSPLRVHRSAMSWWNPPQII